MLYSVEAHFDDQFDALIYDLWQRLAEKGIPIRGIENGHRPHMALAFGDGINVPNVKDILRQTVLRAPELVFCSLGTFANEAGVVFLSPIVSADLIRFHATVHKHLCACFADPSPLYLPGRWYPHCTLASRLTRPQVSAAMTILEEFELPQKATIVSLGLVAYPQWTLLSSRTIETEKDA